MYPTRIASFHHPARIVDSRRSHLLVALGVQGMEEDDLDLEDPARPSVSPAPLLCASQKEEIAFQKAWVAYLWCRAAAAQIEPQVGCQAVNLGF